MKVEDDKYWDQVNESEWHDIDDIHDEVILAYPLFCPEIIIADHYIDGCAADYNEKVARSECYQG